MTRYVLALTLLAATATALPAQEGHTTQALIYLESKTPATPKPSDITLKVDNRVTPITSLAPVPASGAQVAILIDDGLRVGLGRQLGDLRDFIKSLRPGTEIFVGYMQNGRVVATQPFTSNLAAAATSLRVPQGAPGISASPYFCLSDFVKSWPSRESSSADLQQTDRPTRKARIVLMITNGVDPYNGSTSIMNQDSPYVASAIRDAQRAGVAVYSIYYGDAGFRGSHGSFSGQSYLQQVAQETGGMTYYQGSGSPISLSPFLTSFQKAIAESYIATFDAPSGKSLVDLSAKTSLSKTKVHAPQQVRPGTQLGTGQ
jgi:hypothetical protein